MPKHFQGWSLHRVPLTPRKPKQRLIFCMGVIVGLPKAARGRGGPLDSMLHSMLVGTLGRPGMWRVLP